MSIAGQTLVPHPPDDNVGSFNLGKALARLKYILFTRHILSPAKSTFCCNSVDVLPKLPILRHFPVKDGSLDVAEKIGTDYKHFGTLLLNDSDGSKVNNIDMSKRGNPVLITVEILEQWLQGRGRMPVTWQTLIECLRDMNMIVLANKIETTLSKHTHSQEL